MVKTFWGWREQQLPDGTLILTSPAERTHVTTPAAPCYSQVCAHPPASFPSTPHHHRTTAPTKPP
ncbi:hypothetical protein I546_1887 [Mycobacterium kansasii 732]|nr:hypothetical protein I546_1887 [Mycobacterium kansasii 732]